MIKWLRGAHGEKRGVILSWAPGRVLPASAAAQPRELEYWRICDCCSAEEAVVFCIAHALYLCSDCLNLGRVRSECRFMSVAAARAWYAPDEVAR